MIQKPVFTPDHNKDEDFRRLLIVVCEIIDEVEEIKKQLILIKEKHDRKTTL